MTTNVTTQDLKLIIESYKAWRFLNATLSHFASRTVNFPEAISESLCCYSLGYGHELSVLVRAAEFLRYHAL